MCQQHLKGHTLGDIVGTVNSFNRRRKSLIHQDIYKYTDLKELENEILDLNPSKSERKYLKSLKDGLDYVLLYEKENISLYAILTYKGMRNIGDKTRWCVVANKNYWKSYSSYGDFYILIDSRNKSNKYYKTAIHVQKNTNAVYYYDANDHQYNFVSVSHPDVYNEIHKSINLISKIKGSEVEIKTKKAQKEYTFILESALKKKKSAKTNVKDKTTIDLVKEIRDKKLWSFLRVSNRKNLIDELKDEYKKYGPAISFESSNSVAFNEVFQNEFKTDDIVNGLKKSALKKVETKAYADMLKTLTDDEFAKFVNECSRATTRKYVLELRPSVWNKVKKDKISIGIASFLLDKYGIEVIDQVAHLAKNQTSYWNRNSDNGVLKKIKKLKIPVEKAEELLQRNDLHTRLRKFLEKKKKKKLSAKEKNALKDSITNLIDSGVVDKEFLDEKELANLLKEIKK